MRAVTIYGEADALWLLFGVGCEVEDEVRVAFIGKLQSHPPGASGACELHAGVRVDEIDGVVAGMASLRVLVDARPVAGGPHPAERAVGRAGEELVLSGLVLDVAYERHYREARQAKVVQKAEAGDAADGVLVSAVPYVALIVRAELDHAERHGWSRKQHPSRVGCAGEYLDRINRRGKRRIFSADHLPKRDGLDRSGDNCC